MLKEVRKRLNNRSKKTWRKNIDSSEFDNYLEDKLRHERVGSLDDKKDEDLFVIDTKPDVKRKNFDEKNQDAVPRCHQILQSSSAVPDPIKKRNRVRSKEERKHPIRKRIDEYKRLNGIVSKRVIESRKQSKLAVQRKKLRRKPVEFNKDIWNVENQDLENVSEWLAEDTVRHTLTNTGKLQVNVPKEILKKKSVIPTIEYPHPGMSYNPSYEDHQNLLEKVVEKEQQILREEAHIARTTTQMFSKVSPEEKERAWIEEMSQGIVKCEEDKHDEDQNCGNDYKAINPPTSFEKKKTLKQRRKQREQKEENLRRKKLKLEKKKVADIYKLKFLTNEIEVKENKQIQFSAKRKEKTALKKIEPKRLGLQKYSEPDLEFTRGCDLKGNLRSMKPEGHIITDRFYSLQKRNILVPSLKVTRFKKAKVKRFVKASHRIEEKPVTQRKKMNSKKQK